MTSLALSKHHGLGNDFLVLLDVPEADLGALARKLCDRRRGIGADGLIAVLPGEPIRMVLHNADGGRAEMSGNGIRCLGQAVVDAGLVASGRFDVLTDAGLRRLDVAEESRPGMRDVTVDMGEPRIVSVRGAPDWRAEVDLGNPHLVLLDDEGVQDIEVVGPAHPDVNVEIIRIEDGGVRMSVHERGVGLTQACGTGSVASAAAARAWELVGERVVVRNPGGDLVVDLSDGAARLTGPSEYVGRIEVPESTWR